MQMKCCTRPVLLPPFLTSLETRPSILPHPSFPSGPLFKPPCLLSSAPAWSPSSHPHLSLCSFQIFCSIFWPPSLGGGKQQPIFSHSSSIPVAILFSPSAETVPRSSASLGECCAARTAYPRQRSGGGDAESESSDACSEVGLLWLC